MNISKKHLSDFIKYKLKTDKGWAIGALEKLYNKQDEEDEKGYLVLTTLEYMKDCNGQGEIYFEKKSEINLPEKYILYVKHLGTRLNNGIGFNKYDAEILTSFYEFYNTKKFLTEKQYALLFKKIPKYHKQIYDISDKDKLRKAYLKDIHCLTLK